MADPAEFKAKEVLEVLKENETLSEIAGRHGIHPAQIARWKRTFLDRSPEMFSQPGKDEAKQRASQEDDLYKKIGRLQVELDWLKKKSGISI